MRYGWAITAVLVSNVFLTTADVHADTTELYGKTLVCSHQHQGGNWRSHMTIYVTKERVFSYHGQGPARLGVVYEVGRQRSGTSSVNDYTSSAQVSSSTLDLNYTVTNRSCRICDGKVIMQSNDMKVSSTGRHWMVTRNYRQWFQDGTPVAVPSGSEQYTCKLSAGRKGVGG